MMYLSNQLCKARKEIDGGLKDKACKRLQTVLNTFPDSMEAREMLAQMYYEAGFLDAAGRYWLLTEPNESHIKECVQIYKRSVGYSEQQMLKDLKYRGDKTGLTEYANRKLSLLESSAHEKTGFKNNYKKFTALQSTEKKQVWSDKVSGCIGLGILAAIVLCFLAGLVSIFKFIINLFT